MINRHGTHLTAPGIGIGPSHTFRAHKQRENLATHHARRLGHPMVVVDKHLLGMEHAFGCALIFQKFRNGIIRVVDSVRASCSSLSQIGQGFRPIGN